MALCEGSFRSGRASFSVSLQNPTIDSAGRLLIGYNAASGAHFSAGIGGHTYAYLSVEFIPNFGWVPLHHSGQAANLDANTPYPIAVSVQGQRIQLYDDNIRVLDGSLPHPLLGDQAGLFAWGPSPVTFQDVVILPSEPKAFVVMQFGEPYDSLYREVIKPVCNSKGFEAYRADDVYRPGIILQDIIKGIMEAEVVVAEISTRNANVFYELGYAHAVGKSTILLVERGTELPFDIRSYRCIFYEDTIRGKNDVEINLGKHLESIRGTI